MKNIGNWMSHFTPLRMATLYISMLFPKDKKLMLFGSWFGTKYADNAKYLYEFILNNRKDLHPIWMTKSKDVYLTLAAQGLPVCMSGTKQGIKYAMKAGVVFFCTHNQEDIGVWESHFIGRAVLMNLWHGIPLKKIMYDDEYNNLRDHPIKNSIRDAILSVPLRESYLCSSSPDVTKIFKSAFRMVDEHVVELGQPRLDYFYKNNDYKYKKVYGEKRIIVYLPTHRNEGKTRMNLETLFDLERLNRLCVENNCVFLMKKHFYHHNEPLLRDEYSNVKEISNDKSETQELLGTADVLVTDFSSCYVDYLLLDRPMVFYAYDYDEYMNADRQLYFDGINTEPGPQCRTYDEFEDALRKVLNGQDEFIEDRKNIRRLFYGDNVGKLACPRIIDFVEKI